MYVVEHVGHMRLLPLPCIYVCKDMEHGRATNVCAAMCKAACVDYMPVPARVSLDLISCWGRTV